ncbi:restriction endonuclease subunit S [Lactococcus garvieae]|nr:restriction endonuclease subunit S [Lactococcus garvieae]MDT2742850.1 restriction endonuclease subunit S [Lactococcus garvieae]
MMSKKSPQLRFEGFTDDWELRKLGDEVKINGRIGFRGYTQADIVTKETGVLAYSPTNIVNNRLYRKQSDTYITKQKYRESPEIMVKNSDILFVKTGSTLGKSALVQSINYHATVNPQIVIIRSNELDEYFLSVILTSYNILKRINTIKIGGAIPTMTETELKKFPIQVPKSTEQKKIGSFFKQLDNTIALHQRKLDLLKEQKKGFLQKMFPKNGAKVPELRFAGFADDWEERKLGEISKMYQPLTITGNDLLPDGVPVFGANGFIGFFSEANHIDDQVTISARGEGTGTPSYVHGPVWITGNSMVVNVGDFDIDKYFLFANLTANSLKKYVTGGAQPQLTRDVLVKVPITLPNTDEQKKIGAFFKQFDDTITLHQRKLDLLKEQKKGFLQKMFV